MNTPSLPIPYLRARSATCLHSRTRSTPLPEESLDLRLARACAREAALGDQLETWSLVFFGASALSLIIGCAFHLERFVANWDSFESFVQAMLR